MPDGRIKGSQRAYALVHKDHLIEIAYLARPIIAFDVIITNYVKR